MPDGPVVEFNFTDSAQGWSANEDAAAANSYNALQLTMAEGKDDPNITYLFAEGLKTSTYPILQIKMRNRTAGTQFNVYFAGEGEAIDGTKVATFSVSADNAAYQIYTFNLAAASSWSDADVYTLRIDPTDKGNGEVLIDYIRFYRSESEAELNGAYEDALRRTPERAYRIQLQSSQYLLDERLFHECERHQRERVHGD